MTDDIAPLAETVQPLVPEHRQAEYVAASIMQQFGFMDARATPGSRDGGIDVNAKKAIAQVKWTTTQVGRADLQRLCGADRGAKGRNRRLVFFSKTGYSPEAVRFADEAKMFLFTFTLNGKVEAKNRRAHKILRSDTKKFRVRNFSKYNEVRAERAKNSPSESLTTAIVVGAVLLFIGSLIGGGYLLVRGSIGLIDATPSAVVMTVLGLIIVMATALVGRALWRLDAEE